MEFSQFENSCYIWLSWFFCLLREQNIAFPGSARKKKFRNNSITINQLNKERHNRCMTSIKNDIMLKYK